MKKLLTISIVITLFAALFIGLGTFSVSAATSGNYTYEVSFGEATITDVDTSISGAVTIPSTLGGYPVTSIGDDAFYCCDSLTSVTIPNSVTSIGDYAFYGCTGLTSVTIPDSVTRIGDSAFFCCYDLTGVTIPDGVTSIGDDAFFRCTGLASVTIPDSVTSIGNYAFAGCSSLTKITLPFVGSTLNGTSNTHFGYIFGASSYYDNVDVPSSLKEVVITKATSIDSSAFRYCAGLTSVTIGNGVKSIGYHAFEDCTGLTSVTIGNGVESIGDSAFRGCSSLTKITLPFVGSTLNGTSDTHFGHIFGASSYSSNNSYVPSSLKEVVITKATSIDSSAFYKCTGLTSVTIGDSVTSIGYHAFEGCSSLTKITLPFVGNTLNGTSNTYFGYIFGAYSYSYNSNHVPKSLKEVVITKATSIGKYAFYKCTGLTSVTIGDSVTSIGAGAFEGCSLTKITLPFVGRTLNGTSDTHFGYIFGAYSYSSNNSYVPASLKEVVITKATSIGGNAFYKCTGLKRVTIPDSVTSIGKDAFYDCTNLTKVNITDVKAWCEIEFNNASGNPLYYAENLYLNNELVTDLFIPQGTVNIGSSAFRGCTSLTSVTISDSVTSIDDYAFSGCISLTSVTIPDSVTSIGDYAFEYCTGIKSVTIPDSVTSIGDYTFSNCTGLTSVTIPDSVTSIGDYAFSGCTSLTRVTIPDSVTSIGDYTFSNCTGLKSVTIPDSVTSIDDYAFYECTGLTSVMIPNSVTSIGGYAFYKCTGLTSVVIPDSVTSIGEYAFYSCSKMKDVWYAGDDRSVITIGLDNSPLTYATWHYGVDIVGEHVYDKVCDSICNLCGATRTALAHKYITTTTKATLSANGKKVTKCSVCGKTTSTTTIYRPTSFKLSATSYTYNGAVKTPTVTVKDAAGKAISSSNYTVTYASGRKNAGTYTVKVTMKGNYSGTKTLSFKINPINISKCSVKLSATSYTYNGAVKTPTVTVKNASGTKLTKDTHYTVTYASGRKNAGTYKVTIKMKGNYTGSKTLTFKINPINVSKCELILSNTNYTYDGKSKLPSLTVLNNQGTKLTDSSYTVTYASGRKNVGTYKVTIKMKGNYTGTKTLTFKINPAKTTISKVTPATKSLKVAITKKSTQVTGYQVQYSTSKSFKSVKTVNISSYKTTSTTIKSLKAKTTYYVRVRTYKTVNGVKYYSGWSTVKSAKTK